MASVTVQEFEQAMAAVLKRVGLGEWITVLKHGRPVARLGPPTELGLHIGSRYGSGASLTACGRRLTRGAYLDVLAADRRGDGE